MEPLSELDVTLALDECRKPRHIALMLGQLCKERGMGRTIDGLACVFSFCSAFVDIKESSKTQVSDFDIREELFYGEYSPESTGRVCRISNT